MRIIACIVGFIIYGLTLFFIIGDALYDRSWLDSFGEWDWVAAIGLIVADIAVPIPATAIITVMGQRYGVLLGGLIGTVGSFAAAVIAYGLARMLGRRFSRWLLGDDLEKAEYFFRHGGGFAVACSRWLPLLPEAISCLAGLSRMPFGRYCVAVLVGALPMSYCFAVLTMLPGDDIVPIVVSIIIPIPLWWVAARLLRRHAGSRGKDDGDLAHASQSSDV